MDSQKDRIGTLSDKVHTKEILSQMQNSLLLSDVWRAQNPEEKRYSWYRCRPKLTASRIDYALISVGLVDLCENAGYTTGIKTDHLAFFLFFLIDSEPRGAGYWKLNTRHLYNSDYIELINQIIEQVKTSCEGQKTAKDTWEYLKFRIREVSQTFSKQAASETELIISQLSEKVDEMHQNLEKANLCLLEDTQNDLISYWSKNQKLVCSERKHDLWTTEKNQLNTI